MVNNTTRILDRKNTMKKYSNYIFGAIIALLAFTTFDGCTKNNKLSFDYYKLKGKLTSVSQDLQTANGSLSSMINDMNTSISLKDSLQARLDELGIDNQNLKDEILDIQLRGEEINKIQTLKYVYRDRIDTVYQPIKKLNWTNYHYPSKESWIVRHKLWVQSDSVQYSSWDFSDVEFDMIVSEVGGSYTSTIVGPDFLKVKSLKVNSLPIQKNIVTDDFDWMAGAGYRFDKSFSIYGGARWKKNIIFGGLDSQKTFSVNYLRGI